MIKSFIEFFENRNDRKVALLLVIVFMLGLGVGILIEQRSYSREMTKMIFNNLENHSKELTKERKQALAQDTKGASFDKSFDELMEKKRKEVDDFHDSIEKSIKKVDELADKSRHDFDKMQKNVRTLKNGS